MKRSFPILLLGALTAIFTLPACDDDGRGGGVNIFSIEDDKQLGRDLRDEILANPQEFPVLNQGQNPDAYAYLQDIVDEILQSGEVKYADEFAWEVYLIDDPETLNAFAAPGGYIFVYTGLIKFLEEKDDFVGVMGHEIAHADLRHSTQQLTQQYGVATLLSLLLGQDSELLQNVLGSLLSLKFSRDDESQADEFSVIYLCQTEYAANGAASFFEKLVAQGTANPPEFLSTHPSPDNRVEDINMEAQDRNCDTSFDSDAQAWMDFQNSLP
jgi:beta-barrel assembly-enhancing protease